MAAMNIYLKKFYKCFSRTVNLTAQITFGTFLGKAISDVQKLLETSIQDGHHDHIWSNPLTTYFLQTLKNLNFMWSIFGQDLLRL